MVLELVVSGRVDVFHHMAESSQDSAKLDQLIELTQRILNKEQQIMSTQQEALDAIKVIDDATTKQGTVLATEATTLQTISTNLDALIAKIAAGDVSPVVMAGLAALSTHVGAVGVSMQAQSDFATQLASKGAVTPVPVPVPAPTPAPTPAP